MFRKSSSLSLLWTSGWDAVLARKGIATLVLGLSALALAAAVALLVMPAVAPSVSPGSANLERSAADHERATAASAARYQALAEYYGAKTANLERSAAASAARWNGLAAAYAADYERAAAASAARYQALAKWYAQKATSGE
jgi:hypothetical protein